MLSRVTLNNTDLDISVLCYGTNKLGWMLDQEQSNRILDTFHSHGGNFLDTAASYGDWIPDIPRGASETAIGQWLKGKKREDVIIATKGGMLDMRSPEFRLRANAKDIEEDLTASLERLGVKTIDLYFVHQDDPSVPVEEMIDALNKHQKAGRIRHFGASNWAPARIEAANAYAKKSGQTGFAVSETFWGLALPNEEVANQHGYVLHYEQQPDYAKLHKAGLPFMVFSAQSDGYFTKVANGTDPKDIAQGRYDNPANAARLKAAQSLAEKHGVSLNTVVLSYLLSQPDQTIPIFGTGKVEQMEESITATKLKLSAAELSQLRGA